MIIRRAKVESYREQIEDLEREMKYMVKEFEVRGEEIRLEEKEISRMHNIDLARKEALNEELRKRLDESPYKQLQEILKALVVKLPTLNLEVLNIEKNKK